MRQGNQDKAEPPYEKSLEGRREVLGEQHADTLVSLDNLVGLNKRQKHAV